MAAATAAVIAVSAVAGAYSASKAASAAKKTAQFNQSESARAQQMEQERVNLQRNSPAAGFAAAGFGTIMDIFGKSMAGKMSGFNAEAEKQRMGIGQWHNFDEREKWMNRQGQSQQYGAVPPGLVSDWQAKRPSGDLVRAFGGGGGSFGGAGASSGYQETNDRGQSY